MTKRKPQGLDALETNEKRSPASSRQMYIPHAALHEVFEHLDAHSTDDAWQTACRIQFVHDKEMRALDWWHKTIWRPGGCRLKLSALKRIAYEKGWQAKRDDLWDRVFNAIEENVAEAQSEYALTVYRKMQGIEAVVLDKLSPVVTRVTQPDGTVTQELELKVEARSYEGLVGALVKVQDLKRQHLNDMSQILGGDRPKLESKDSGKASTSIEKLKKQDKLRRMANLLAVGESDDDDE